MTPFLLKLGQISQKLYSFNAPREGHINHHISTKYRLDF